MSYNAVVAKVTTRPHPNADRLLLGTCKGYQVIVGLETESGEMGVFFASDGQLSVEFAEEHDLVGYTDPETGKRAGGYFPKNRRVRAQKLRGEKSEGFWVPLSYFEFTGYDVSTLKEGMEFCEMNDVPICNKFVTKATKMSSAGAKSHRKETKWFRMHVDTKQFRLGLDDILPDDVITITEKVHGTSHRFGYLPDDKKQKLSFWDRLFRRKPAVEYFYMSGTRRVVMRDGYSGYYEDESFRSKACKPLVGNLMKGETVFFEIVGFENHSRPIMGSHDISKLRDKSMLNKYGKSMQYTYGCLPGEFKIFVYRMTMTNEDGYTVEYPWPKVKQRCRALGVMHVEQLEDTMVGLLHLTDEEKIEMMNKLAEGESVHCSGHIREGVVIRVDKSSGDTSWLKHKSWEFGILEGYLKEQDAHVDIEEAS